MSKVQILFSVWTRMAVVVVFSTSSTSPQTPLLSPLARPCRARRPSSVSSNVCTPSTPLRCCFQRNAWWRTGCGVVGTPAPHPIHHWRAVSQIKPHHGRWPQRDASHIAGPLSLQRLEPQLPSLLALYRRSIASYSVNTTRSPRSCCPAMES